jgi:hypothetical protein
MKFYKDLFRLGIIISLIIFGYIQGQAWLRHHPITLKHPFPQFSRKVPFVVKLDKWFAMTAGIQWYKVKSRAGKEYFAQEWEMFERGRGWYQAWAVMDEIKRDKWIPLTREQFGYLFGSPADGKGYSFPYDLKDDGI